MDYDERVRRMWCIFNDLRNLGFTADVIHLIAGNRECGVTLRFRQDHDSAAFSAGKCAGKDDAEEVIAQTRELTERLNRGDFGQEQLDEVSSSTPYHRIGIVYQLSLRGLLRNGQAAGLPS